MPLELKTVTVKDATGADKVYAEVKDGKPVYKDGASEIAYDVPAAALKITELNSEAKTHRIAKETAETALAAFKDLDPVKAREALNTIKNFDDKKLIDAGKVEEIKQEAIKAVRAEYEPVVKERDTLKGELASERIGTTFRSSKYIADKMSVASDVVQAVFGKQFKEVDGKLVAHNSSGNPIYSPTRPGELASFDEGLEEIVKAYAHKDTLLKGTGGGSGAKNKDGSGGNQGGKTLTRAEWNALAPLDQTAKMKEGYQVVDAA